MRTEELDIEIADIEVYASLFLFCGYNPGKNRRYQYEISHRKNTIDGLVKHLREDIVYMVSYNGCMYDNQVLQYILDNHEKWFDLSSSAIIRLIYQFSQELISNQDYELQPPYKEHYMDVKQIDVFRIMHYDNKNRRTGLKWAGEFSLDGNIEELPIDYTKPTISDAEIEETIQYCWNDVNATHSVYKIVAGDTGHELYAGKDKIQLRLDLIAERGLPDIAINWNDGKIGDELNKRRYMELTGISQNELWDKVKNRKVKTKFRFRDCYPKYTEFDTDEYRRFFKQVGAVEVNLNEKQEFPLRHYMFAKGGGHSTEGARVIRPTANQILRDADVGSMYPWNIAKNMIYPAHLGPKWNEGYVENIPLRIQAKKKYKDTKDKKYESFAESYKYVLNINFGKLLDRQNWQYDPYAGMRTTIGGQIDIFMLAEDIEQAGMQVVSMNTDGLVVLMDKSQEQDYIRVCTEWEKQVGNSEQGKLEYADYELLVQTSVNDYLAIKKGTEPIADRVKKKGDWLTSYELHKNKSKSIVPIALEQYWVYGKPIEETIRNYPSIWPFCIAKKASKDYSYQGTDRKTGKTQQYRKLIRYYCSKGVGEKIYKVKNENSTKTGPRMSQVEADSDRQMLFNTPVIHADMAQYQIDYEYYIRAANKLMDAVDPEYQRARKIRERGIQELF